MTRRLAIPFVFFALAAHHPGRAVAADVTFEEETTMGGLPRAPGLPATRTRTEVSGGMMRTESGSEVTLVDLDAERVLTLDTRRRTYTVTTFREMRESLESAMRSSPDGRPRPGPGDARGNSNEVTATTDVRVTETGVTETIAGHECRQFLLELDVKLDNPGAGASGVVTMLNELWIAKDITGADELQTFQKQMAEKLGTSELAQTMFTGGTHPLATSADVDLGRISDEMKKIEGFPMRTVNYFGAGGAGGAGEANAMRVTRETRTITTTPIDPARFAVPEGYRKVERR